MSISDISEFLRVWDSSLQYLITNDYDGITKTATEIIWLASSRYAVNPQYTLVLLQKEQGLIEKESPSQRDLDWATGYAVCDSCTTTDTAIQKYKGFGKQIDNGVGFMEFFYDNPDKASPFIVGVPVNVTDRISGGGTASYTIIPENQATANLYKYTPHHHGNNLFWSLFRKYFGRAYPDGTLVKKESSPDVYVIQDGTKRKINSFSVLVSRYNPSRILSIKDSDLDAFPEGIAVVYPQYSYLRSPSGTVYLIIDDAKHGFSSAEALRLLGINPEEIIDVTDEELLPYTEGKPIDVTSAYPTGSLVKDNVGGSIYYVENGIRFPVWDVDIMKERFPSKKIISITPEEIATYAKGEPLTFSEGALVKSSISPTVYVISDGKRRKIPTEEVFTSLGYNWHSIVTVSEQALLLHPEGAPLS
jgi:hypothetical protein